jgi:3-methyladenine DNA glycosylase AlkD
MIQAYIKELEELYASEAKPEDAKYMAAYMKNQFPFYGIKTPRRRELVAMFLESNGLPDDLEALCRACFAAEKREIHYFVNDALRNRVKKLNASLLPVFSDLIAQNSWWDSVDFLAPKLAGGILLRHPGHIEALTGTWIESDDFWYQRAAIIFQLDHKKKTDADRLFAYILRRADSKEFFVQKGAGWALRTYASVDPEAVMKFVTDHNLSALTKREAIRKIID